MEQSFGALLKQLPNKAEMDALLADINQAGLGRGLQFELFKPAAKERMANFCELPISVKITGNYHDMGAFASDVAQLPRIVTLETTSNDKGVLTLDAVAKTFPVALDEKLSKQRKAAKDAKDKAKEMGRWVALSLGACVLLSRAVGGKKPPGSSRMDRRHPGQGRAARAAIRCRPGSTVCEPFAYNAFDLPDPFKPRKIEPTKGGSKLAPDLTRRREPLEAYPLESLNMVGTLTQGKSTYALVRTPDKDVYQVTTGNYLGRTSA